MGFFRWLWRMIGHRGTSGRTTVVVPPAPILQALALSASLLTENSPAGTIVGAIQNTTTGSALSLSDSAGGRFAISGTNIVAGPTLTNYEIATSHSITVVETLSGATGTPKSTALTISIVNVFEQPNLGALTFSATIFLAATSSSGTINGATSGSVIIASGLPAGLIIDGAARTWAWAGGSPATGSFTLTESLTDSANSPVVNTISYTITTTPGALQVLTLSSSSITENSVAGTLVGTIQNVTAGSALTLSDSAGSRFAVSGGNIVAGTIATDYETATTHNITIVETLAGATGTPKSTTIAITVINVFEQPNLVALVFSSTIFVTNAPASGSITGATSSSTVTASGLPAGLTINGPLRTWAWDGTGSTGSGTLTLTETLADSANSPRATAIGYSISALTAPVISLAVAPLTYPPQINFDFMSATAQSGDILAVRKSTTYPVPSGATTAQITLTDAIIAAGSFSFATQSDTPTFLSAIVSPAQTFFDCYLIHAAVPGPDGNTIKHGDATAPTMTTSSPTSAAENQLVVANLVLSEPVTVSSISGTDGALLKIAETSASSTLTVELLSGLNTNYEVQTSYSYTLNVADLAGNTAALAMVSNITDQDEVPNAFTFTDQTGASLSTAYTAPAITVAGLGTGVPAQVTVTGGTVSINSGAFGASGTVFNGDTVAPKGTSSGSYSTAVNVVVSIGEPAVSDTFTITTMPDPSRVGFTASTTQPASISNGNASATYNFTSDFVVGGYGVIYIPALFSGRTVSSIKILGAGAAGADITLLQRATIGTSPQYIYCCPDAQTIVTGTARTVQVVLSAVYDVLSILCGTLTNASTTVPTATCSLAFPVSVNPFSATAPITVSATGVGVAFAQGNGGGLTAVTGTLLTTGLNNFAGTGDFGAISRQITSGAWTPSFNQGSQQGAGILAAQWG